MALVSDLIQVGLNPRQAAALGDILESLAAAGTVIGDATQGAESMLYVTSSSGANAGIKLPAVAASKSKAHLVLNDTANVTRVYVQDGATESFKLFGAATGAATYVNCPANGWVMIRKLTDAAWGAFR